jgi:AcrR family transcriptional regulator
LYLKNVTNNALPIRADAQRNYDRLVEAAHAVFAMQGAQATLDGIAKQAGLGIGTLYRHFPTRKSLLEAVFADKIASLVNKVPSLLQETSADTALTSWLKTTVDYSAKYAGFSDLMGIMTKDENSPLAIAGSKLLSEAQKTGVLRSDITILDLLQLVYGIVGDTSSKELKRTDKLLSIVIAGLKR